MTVLPLLLLITLSEATIGVFVKLTDGRIPVWSLNFYALSPVVASTLGFVIFDEVPGPGMVAGGTLLLGAGAWLTVATSRGREQQAVHACQCEAC